MVERIFLAVPRGCLRFVIVVFPDHTHLLFLLSVKGKSMCTKFWLPLVQALLCELKTDMIVAADLDVKKKKKKKPIKLFVRIQHVSYLPFMPNEIS